MRTKWNIEITGKITNSIADMKDMEKAYERNLEWLAFGVKLWDNGDVTYHANYKDYEDRAELWQTAQKSC